MISTSDPTNIEAFAVNAPATPTVSLPYIERDTLSVSPSRTDASVDNELARLAWPMTESGPPPKMDSCTEADRPTPKPALTEILLPTSRSPDTDRELPTVVEPPTDTSLPQVESAVTLSDPYAYRFEPVDRKPPNTPVRSADRLWPIRTDLPIDMCWPIWQRPVTYSNEPPTCEAFVMVKSPLIIADAATDRVAPMLAAFVNDSPSASASSSTRRELPIRAISPTDSPDPHIPSDVIDSDLSSQASPSTFSWSPTSSESMTEALELVTIQSCTTHVVPAFTRPETDNIPPA